MSAAPPPDGVLSRRGDRGLRDNQDNRNSRNNPNNQNNQDNQGDRGDRGDRGAERRPADRIRALDGIRTVAVFLVILFHVRTPGLTGGFLGVDVFFVLSGYLITTLLLSESASRGRPDLGRFWARRVTRLMPASTVVILAVLIWTAVAAPVFQVSSLTADALWSLLYVGNWRFVTTSNYFAEDGTSSPLLHVWSLAVEEQFYVVWPLLVTLVALWAARRTAAARRTSSTGDPQPTGPDTAPSLSGPDAAPSPTGPDAAPSPTAPEAASREGRPRRMAWGTAVLALVLGVASAYLLLRLWAPSAPDRAYMGTDSKVFEPLIGAALAALLLRPGPAAFARRHAAWLGPGGLAGLLAGVPLLAGAEGPRRAYFAGGAVVFCLFVAALVAAVAVQPGRAGLARGLGWGPVAYLGRISYGIYLWHWPYAVWLLPPGAFDPVRAALVVALTVATAALSFHLIETPLRTSRFGRARPRVILAAAAAVLLLTTNAAAALGRLSLDTVLAARGTAATRVMVVGDSVVQRLLPDLAEAGHSRDVIISSASRGGCSVLGAQTVTDAGTVLDPACEQMPAVQTEELARTRPDVVLWWSRYELADRLGPDGRTLRAHDQAFWDLQARELTQSIDRLTATGARLVIVAPDRVGPGIYRQCPDGACESFVTRLATDTATSDRWTALLRQHTTDPRVRLVEIDDLYCRDAASPCDDRLPLREAGAGAFPPPTTSPARADGSHFSPAAAPVVAAVLLDRVLRAARLPDG